MIGELIWRFLPENVDAVQSLGRLAHDVVR